jgi:uncharacterized protein YraI
MTRSSKRLLIVAAILVGFLALLNPGYSSARVVGPDGTVHNTQNFRFGPGGMFVHTRVVADGSSVTIEHR